jgi:hypothetical protein
MARIGDIVFDCRHPAGLARFWAQVLDGYAVAPYDAAELARLRDRGIDDPEDDPTVLVESADSPVRLWFQRVPEPKVVKNRVHLDLRCPGGDADAEARRLVALGATLATDQPHPDLLVLHDPEGNELCLLRG